MSKLLVELLEAKEPLFSHALRQLEQASGKQGVDVRLTAEIVEKSKAKIKAVGLDPSDTTGPELYRALINLVKDHDLHLAKQIGGSDPTDVATMMPLVQKAVAKADMPRDCWVLKHPVAKEMIRARPPRNIMTRMGYRSVEAMLKKENLAEIYGALRFAETPDWLAEFNKQYVQLKPSDFETRQIEIVPMPADRWGELAVSFVKKKRHNITHLKELGVIMMLPILEPKMAGITLMDMPLIFHYFNEIRLYSAFFKLEQVKPDFGQIFVNTLNADPGHTAVMAGQHIHWRVIQRYFGKLTNEYHPEIFEPHVQPEDLHWRTAEELLYQIDPELKFWDGLDYVALMFDGRPLSLNLMDMSFNYADRVPYEARNIYHFRESLWNEIFMRYLGVKTLRDQVLKQLDNDLIAPENLATA